MRFLGTLKVELDDGTTEQFKDRTDAKWDSSNSVWSWWTHEFEKEWDDTLVVNRRVASISSYDYDEGDYYPTVLRDQPSALTEHVDEVARYRPGAWRTIKRK